MNLDIAPTHTHVAAKSATAQVPTREISAVFLGTGTFAATILEIVRATRQCRVSMIVTQPDRKVGRKTRADGRDVAKNAVRDIALEHGIALIQPPKLDDTTIDLIATQHPDVLVVASYGRILPQRLLDVPRIAPLNVHASLLPKFRGASPIHNAILHGATETGVTIMLMDAGMDTGAIVAQESTPIAPHEKTDELSARLARIGGRLLVTTLHAISDDMPPAARAQDDADATLCQLIEREDGHIQWMDGTADIYNRYRALYPWPGVFGFWEIAENHIIRVHLRSIAPYTETLRDDERAAMPGTVYLRDGQMHVRTGDGAIVVHTLQQECKTTMSARDFLNGHNHFNGAVLK